MSAANDRGAGISLRDRSPRPYQFQDSTHSVDPQDPTEQQTASRTRSQKHVDKPDERIHSSHDEQGSESGTEADDESPRLLKALPPAKLQLRKGLKHSDGTASPLLTPSQLDWQGQRLSQSYFEDERRGRKAKDEVVAKLDAERRLFTWRRRFERLRRLCEAALLGGIALTIVYGSRLWQLEWQWYLLVVLSQVFAIAALVAFYPLRLVSVEHERGHVHIWSRFHIPPSFDPATVLYPTFVPVLVSLALVQHMPDLFLSNVVLGLASLPPRLFPSWALKADLNTLHWTITLSPVLASQGGAWLARRFPLYLSGLRGPQGLDRVPAEMLLTLFPMHQALFPAIHFLSTTSLLPAEKQMLVTALVNLLLFPQTPQAIILQIVIWVGGFTTLASSARILRWNVDLARVPPWRLRDLPRPREHGSLTTEVSKEIYAIITGAFRKVPRDDRYESDADEDEPQLHRKRPLSLSRHDAELTAEPATIKPALTSDWHAMRKDSGTGDMKRRNTTGSGRAAAALPHEDRLPFLNRQRSRRIHWTRSLTPFKATLRKRFYATYIYLAVLVTVLLPVRLIISHRALLGAEPIIWAIEYLFSGLPTVYSYLTSRDTITVKDDFASVLTPSTNIIILREIIGAANSRLAIIAWDLLVLAVGLSAVLILSPVIEVDTRRKVFHAIMVAMFLPTIYVDPCFCALALSLVLAIFLILEVIRAGQVPPLGTAIGRFVAPYVDGRDLRGPMVVSHVFLLIGCAIPFWLSLAGFDRERGGTWDGWELAGDRREVAMLSGVVCVGMGDAAASLIGRRYGRRKWPWIGGKSLEGSAAFAAAVVAGLSFAKFWLRAGGWVDVNALPGLTMTQEVTVFLIKASLAGCGASFLEAVLTGANDNVMVPVALWLLCRGLRI